MKDSEEETEEDEKRGDEVSVHREKYCTTIHSLYYTKDKMQTTNTPTRRVGVFVHSLQKIENL